MHTMPATLKLGSFCPRFMTHDIKPAEVHAICYILPLQQKFFAKTGMSRGKLLLQHVPASCSRNTTPGMCRPLVASQFHVTGMRVEFLVTACLIAWRTNPTIFYYLPILFLSTGVQADIFSLGIILFELFCAFGTEMERVKNIKDLRQGRLSQDFCDKWPEEVRMMYLVRC